MENDNKKSTDYQDNVRLQKSVLLIVNPAFHQYIDRLERERDLYREALDKISDPRKRDHKEPDDYTEKCCLMHMAVEALSAGDKIREGE